MTTAARDGLRLVKLNVFVVEGWLNSFPESALHWRALILAPLTESQKPEDLTDMNMYFYFQPPEYFSTGGVFGIALKRDALNTAPIASKWGIGTSGKDQQIVDKK